MEKKYKLKKNKYLKNTDQIISDALLKKKSANTNINRNFYRKKFYKTIYVNPKPNFEQNFEPDLEQPDLEPDFIYTGTREKIYISAFESVE